MKMLFTALLAAALMHGAPVPVPVPGPVPALADTPNASPLIGSWVVDVSRLPMPPQERPKRVTITFDDVGNGKWVTQVDILDLDGAERHAKGAAALDGTATPVTANFEADVVAMRMPMPNVLVMMLAKNGMPASTRIYTVAADGKSMVENVAHFRQDGSPMIRTNYFTRVR